MADTADLVVLGAFYGQGSKGQWCLVPMVVLLLEDSHWPPCSFDLLVMDCLVLGSGALITSGSGVWELQADTQKSVKKSLCPKPFDIN